MLDMRCSLVVRSIEILGERTQGVLKSQRRGSLVGSRRREDERALLWLLVPYGRVSELSAEAARQPRRAAAPEGGLFFAGEHTSSTPAWIEGALESAEAAVAALHTDLALTT